jgi:flagellar basal-body rod modification protein FlgD
MTTMGRPVSDQEKSYSNVTIGPKTNNKKPVDDSRQKEMLLNKLTGYKPKNDLYADAKTKGQMGKDEFLKLLTYQLQNQDPHNPMDQKEMSGQLAQFSQLEQLANLNTKFDGLTRNQNVEDKFYGASFLGKEVVTTGSSLKLTEDGASADVLYTLPKEASKVLVRVFDNNNAMVGEMWKENIGRGNQTATWDGVMLDGQPSAKGDYRVQVYAWDQNAEPIQVETKVKGVVQSVFFENGENVLMVDGKKVFLRDVDSFHTPGHGKVSQDRQPVAASLSQIETARQILMHQNCLLRKMMFLN